MARQAEKGRAFHALHQRDQVYRSILLKFAAASR